MATGLRREGGDNRLVRRHRFTANVSEVLPVFVTNGMVDGIILNTSTNQRNIKLGADWEN
jgi:hypothetical protein